jgi:hypothetical protein
MSRFGIRLLFGIILSAALVLTVAAQSQPSTEISAAPLPGQLLAAKRMFIANGAGDNDPGITKYTNGPDGLYNQLYADVKALGRYELVTSPSDADVVLELRIEYAVFNHDFTYPKLKAEIRDPKTNVLLWTFTEPVNGALLAKSGRKNVAQSLSKLIDDLKKVGTSQ